MANVQYGASVVLHYYYFSFWSGCAKQMICTKLVVHAGEFLWSTCIMCDA